MVPVGLDGNFQLATAQHCLDSNGGLRFDAQQCHLRQSNSPTTARHGAVPPSRCDCHLETALRFVVS